MGFQPLQAVVAALSKSITLLQAPHLARPQVTFCQQSGQAMRVASRCLWDPANDGSACGHFENDTLVCACQVWHHAACLTCSVSAGFCVAGHSYVKIAFHYMNISFYGAGVRPLLRVTEE